MRRKEKEREGSFLSHGEGGGKTQNEDGSEGPPKADTHWECVAVAPPEGVVGVVGVGGGAGGVACDCENDDGVLLPSPWLMRLMMARAEAGREPAVGACCC